MTSIPGPQTNQEERLARHELAAILNVSYENFNDIESGPRLIREAIKWIRGFKLKLDDAYEEGKAKDERYQMLLNRMHANDEVIKRTPLQLKHRPVPNCHYGSFPMPALSPKQATAGLARGK